MNDARVVELASKLFSDAQILNNGDSSSPHSASTTTRERILDAAFEIFHLLLDPAELLRMHASQAHLISLHFIQRFNIAATVPPDSGISYAAIATSCGQLEQTVKRILRHAIGLQIFREERSPVSSADDQVLVYHTPASLLLREPSFHAWMGATCEESWPAATRAVDALAAFPEASEPAASGWALAHASPPFPTGASISDPSSPDRASLAAPGQSLYDVIASSPARAARFSQGMSAYSSGPGYSPDHFIKARREFLAGLPKGSRFTDVGGGLGHFGLAVSEEHPQIEFVVQDLPKVVGKAQELCKASDLPRNGEDGGRRGRVVFQAHDFFQPQPVTGAAVYFLRWILHNWSDKYAVIILRNIGQAMTENSRLIIHDYCVDDLATLSMRKRRAATNMDIGMMQLLNAQERDESQWRELLAKADRRFEWIGVTKPPGSALAIIEASWKER
ncbi:hypothetical protein M426DRAFT_147042 [Hypoxylon sp. CI-4A]|nr:hypothetical protein M426DRAFT_147042 [Hypoxylon sp. CI-4A]